MKNKYIIEEPMILMDYLVNVLDKPRKKAKILLTKNAIYINNKNITKYNYPLIPGNILEIKEFNQNDIDPSIKIIYEDKDIIVVDKPAGLLTIATENEKEKTLYHLVSDYVKVKNKNARIFVIHRLDKETSGIIIFAKSENVKRLFQDNWDKYAIYRGYMAIVEGVVEVKNKKILSYLIEKDNFKVYSTTPDKGKKAITNYKFIKSNKKYSLLDINIETGRKNQIRVAMHDIKHPIAGDRKYGSKIDPVRRLCLHCHKLVIYNPILKQEMKFNTEVPEAFKKVIK